MSDGGCRALEEPRINAVVAISPYLTTDRWFDLLRSQHGMYWTPFGYTIFTFWYEMRSGYEIPDRNVEDLRAVKVPTLLLAEAEHLQDEEIVKLQELSESDRLTVAELPEDAEALKETVVEFVRLQMQEL